MRRVSRRKRWRHWCVPTRSAWRELLTSGAIVSGRPDEDTWSSLEYACHVRDVYLRFLDRIGRMLTEDDPRFENWDQDATALDDAHDDQDPAGALGQLEANAEALASRLDLVTGAQWERPGKRSDGSPFSVDSISRYMVHDTIHHVWDVAGAL